MAAEQVLRLLDSFWFETTILTTNKTPSISKLHPTIDSNPKLEKVIPLDTNLLMIPNLEVRSYSDQNLDSTTCDFCDFSSPNSVLTPQKLRTIPSEKEIREFSWEKNHEKEETNHRKNQSFGHERRRRRRRPNKGKTRTSRSLTELEFKELKGFMDLGFVFSEEDKDSKLVSLIPGLMRLGKEEEEAEKGDEEKQNIEETLISNEPYLSEAWDVLEQREKRNPLLNWRIPVVGNEIDMKDNLRFWAHTVASIVR